MKNKGIIALPLILLIGGIILEIAIAFALIAYYLMQSGFGSKFSAEALFSAQAGINDATSKILRNKDFNGSYMLSIDSRHSADIVVCKDKKSQTGTCVDANDGKTEITSLGKMFNKNRRLRAYVNIDKTTGEIRVESVQEITL